MKDIFNKVSLVTAVFIFLVSFSSLVIASNGFPDVGKIHWAKDSIDWGVANKVVLGYADGTFKPNKTVSEQEVLAMLIRTFAGEQKPTVKDKWGSGYYSFAKEKNYPIIDNPNKSINRTQVAELISGAKGVYYKGNDAIQYVLGTQLAQGKEVGKISIESYKGQDLLTRAEALKFIKNAKDAGLTELKSRPVKESNPADLPELPKTYKYKDFEIPLEPVGKVELDKTDVDVDITIFVTHDNFKDQLKEAQAILTSKFGEEFAKQVIDHAAKKQSRSDQIENKDFIKDGILVFVKDGDFSTVIKVFKEDSY